MLIKTLDIVEDELSLNYSDRAQVLLWSVIASNYDSIPLLVHGSKQIA